MRDTPPTKAASPDGATPCTMCDGVPDPRGPCTQCVDGEAPTPELEAKMRSGRPAQPSCGGLKSYGYVCALGTKDCALPHYVSAGPGRLRVERPTPPAEPTSEQAMAKLREWMARQALTIDLCKALKKRAEKAEAELAESHAALREAVELAMSIRARADRQEAELAEMRAARDSYLQCLNDSTAKIELLQEELARARETLEKARATIDDLNANIQGRTSADATDVFANAVAADAIKVIDACLAEKKP